LLSILARNVGGALERHLADFFHIAASHVVTISEKLHSSDLLEAPDFHLQEIDVGVTAIRGL